MASAKRSGLWRPGTVSPALSAAAVVKQVEALYQRHQGFVYRLALRYGSGRAAWAEDITQDVFVDLWKALPKLDDLDDIEGWLYRATTNRSLNRLRHDRFLSLAPVRWLLETRREPAQPDQLAGVRAEFRKLFAALDALAPKERVAFSMHRLDGKDLEEIGRILGHSKGYVCKLIQRAVANLRRAGLEVADG